MHQVMHAFLGGRFPRLALVVGGAFLFGGISSMAVGQGVPGFPNAVVIDVDPGAVGGPATIAGSGTFPADSSGVLDVFLIWEPLGLVAPPDFTYSSSASWQNPAPGARFQEWVGNFTLNPPVAVSITDTDMPGSPAVFAPDNLSVAVTDRTFNAFPIPLGRYHFQIAGLQPGELVTFDKLGVGGQVVPEPVTWALLGIGIGSVLLLRERRRAS